jgi:hypothetical protein
MATDIKNIPPTATYDDLRESVAGPMLVCEARPATASCGAPLAAVLPDVDTIQGRQWQLTLTVLRAEAKAIVLDQGLDVTAEQIIQALLIICDKDTKDDRYTHYMGSMEPAELKAPVLEEELDTLEAWVPDLLSSPYKELNVLGAKLQPQVAEARIAEGELKTARQALAAFREVGEWPALVAEVNAARKGARGDLAAFVLKNPTLGLPKDLADEAFRGDGRTRRFTTKQLKAKLASAQRNVTDLETAVAASEAADKARDEKKQRRADAKKQKAIEKAEKKAAKAAEAVVKLKGK